MERKEVYNTILVTDIKVGHSEHLKDNWIIPITVDDIIDNSFTYKIRGKRINTVLINSANISAEYLNKLSKELEVNIYDEGFITKLEFINIDNLRYGK